MAVGLYNDVGEVDTVGHGQENKKSSILVAKIRVREGIAVHILKKGW